MFRYRRAIDQEAFLRFIGEHPRDMDTPFVLPPRTPREPIRRIVARHVRRHVGLTISGAFWILAAMRSLHENSIKPLLHRAEYRTIVNMLRRR